MRLCIECDILNFGRRMGETSALYCRVSTADQDLSHQRQLTSEYATDRLGVEPADIEMFVDKQSGTNTDQEGYRDLMAAIEDEEISQVIASEVSRISRSVRDFSATVERIVDEHDVGLHILDMGIALDPTGSDPYTRAFLTVAATFAELEAEIKRENVREGIAAAESRANGTVGHRSASMLGPKGISHRTTTTRKRSWCLMNSIKGRASGNSLGISRSTVRTIVENRERSEVG